jgi:hypothetical protein
MDCDYKFTSADLELMPDNGKRYSHGMRVVGPLLDLENPNKFVWLRIFPSLDERERMRTAFYEGELWKNELESIAMSMLESYDVILCETSPGYVFEGAIKES